MLNLPFKKATKGELQAHILQGIEAQALFAVLRRYRKQLLLLEHDGFVATQQLDMTAVEAVVAEAIGCELRLEVEEIRLPAAVDAEKSLCPQYYRNSYLELIYDRRGVLEPVCLLLCARPSGLCRGPPLWRGPPLAWPAVPVLLAGSAWPAGGGSAMRGSPRPLLWLCLRRRGWPSWSWPAQQQAVPSLGGQGMEP